MNARGWIRLGNSAMDDEGLRLDTVDVTTLQIAGTSVTSSAAELNILDGVTATAAEINAAADVSAMVPSTAVGVGISAGTGTVVKRSLSYRGELKILEIFVDITGLGSSTTDLDVIGVAGGGCHFAQILAAEVGTVLAVKMECLEVPATGVTDIILYSADESTLAFDSAISAATGETVLIDNGGAWTVATQRGCTAVPAANQYLYFVNGAAGTVGTYTTGQFLITVIGS